MLKKILLTLAILAICTVALIYFVGSSVLNQGIIHAVEKFGPKVTQTPVRLDEVDVSILSGTGSLKGLYIGNPEKFKSENIFALGQIDLDIDTSTLLSDQIIINKIHIKAPEISYEKSLISSNLKELLDNIEAFTEPSEEKPTADETAETAPKKQVIITQLVIEDGTIYLAALGVGQSVPLPRIEMENVGEGKSIPKVIELVLTEVVKSIGPAIANSGVLLKETGQKTLKSVTDQSIEKVNEGLKGILGK